MFSMIMNLKMLAMISISTSVTSAAKKLLIVGDTSLCSSNLVPPLYEVEKNRFPSELIRFLFWEQQQCFLAATWFPYCLIVRLLYSTLVFWCQLQYVRGGQKRFQTHQYKKPYRLLSNWTVFLYIAVRTEIRVAVRINAKRLSSLSSILIYWPVWDAQTRSAVSRSAETSMDEDLFLMSFSQKFISTTDQKFFSFSVVSALSRQRLQSSVRLPLKFWIFVVSSKVVTLCDGNFGFYLY